ncbi:MAG: copper chaperone PCu(A)C [Burkholderiales bacterium]
MHMNKLMIAAALTLAALGTHAQAAKSGSISVESAYARATVAGQPAGGGFLKLVNAGADDRLVSASSEVAAAVELHLMAMKGDVMQMRQVDAIDVKAGQTVELKPGGYHLMLMGLKAPLKAGSSFPVTLKFEKAGEVTVNVKVEAAGAVMK